jgi:hypothetical protein
MHARKNTKKSGRRPRRPVRASGTALTKADKGVVTTISRGLAFPTATRVHLKYDMYFDASLAANTFTYYEFAANGCYDPDLSGVGHQPYMYDQYTDRYSKYRVLGFRYQVLVPMNNNPAESIKVGTQIRNDNYTPTYPAFFEQPYTKARAGTQGSPTLVLNGGRNLTKISTRPENYIMMIGMPRTYQLTP